MSPTNLDNVVIAANVAGILMCVLIVILARAQYRDNRNPLLILAGAIGAVGLIMFSLGLMLHLWFSVSFLSDIPILMAWAGILFSHGVLLSVLVIHRRFPNWWRGER